MRNTSPASAILLMALALPSADSFNVFRPSKGQVTRAQDTSKKNKKMMVVPPSPPPASQLELEENDPLFSFEESGMDMPNPISPSVWNSVTSTVLGVAAKLAPKDTRKELDSRSVRVRVSRLPPTSIKVDLDDVPVIGKALSGTFAKVKEDTLKSEPSVTIGLPKDVIGAAQQAADDGNLQLGLRGLVQSVVDVQLEPNKPGRAPVEFKSPLIPKWPFAKKQRSPWHKVTNMGNGDIYYFNELSGETRLDKPKRI